eukprot:4803077-Alexandrium_andersonii.AAC.1
MSASLVGSEMCIRDRGSGRPLGTTPRRTGPLLALGTVGPPTSLSSRHGPVSYTHLTLPTICSV